MFQKSFELCDVVSLLMVQDNGSFLLTGVLSPPGSVSVRKSAANMYRLPGVKVLSDEWTQTAVDLTITILGKANKMSLFKLYKVWLPLHAQKFIHHIVYLVNVQKDAKKKSRGNAYKWMSFDEIREAKDVGLLVSPDIWNMVCMFMIDNPSFGIKAQLPENFTLDTILEINEANVMPNINNSSPIHLELFKMAEILRNEQIYLYKDFLLSSFPYLYMNASKFAIAVSDQLPDWTLSDCLELFRAADVTGRGVLTYLEYLLIFAICDVNTPHVGRSAELRCRFIFRFFDRENKNLLTFEQFKKLLRHIRKGKKMPIDESVLEKEADMYTISLGIDAENPLTLNNFMLAAGDLRLRGTGSVLRFTKNLRDYLGGKGIIEEHRPATGGVRQSITLTTLKVATADVESTGAEYALTMHTIIIGQQGKELEVELMNNKTDWISPSTTMSFRSNRKTSIDTFNKKSPSNEIIGALKYFSNVVPARDGVSAEKPAYSWGSFDLNRFATSLLSVCQKAKVLLQADPRLIEVAPPVYVMGDIHGNYMDLMYYEKTLWHLSPTLCPSKLLFLGDYVDRGRFGVEVVAYLLAYKVHIPKKIILLRGNHEIRDIQKAFTFYQECQTKFGESLGTDIWTAINNVFDVLPLAATIDKKIFCCHGGIPPPWHFSDLKAINHIPVPLPLPDQQSDLAWNLMWNDPFRPIPNEATSSRRDVGVRSGFMPNSRRGTGYVFSADALHQFLKNHKFSHMIRAHELQPAGASIQFDGKLLTVFSTSHYCSGTNDAACIFVDDSRIRVLRMKITYD